MIFFKKKKYIQPYIPDNTRVYCIGDIHGCLNLLEDLHNQILNHASGYSGTKILIYVGDYIDRGQHSKEVLDQLIDNPLQGFDITHIRGNHEQSLIQFLEDPLETRAWLTYGGLDTIVSYGVKLAKFPSSDHEISTISQQLNLYIPDSHIEFLNNTVCSRVEGSYFFTHAGIKPGTPLQEQNELDLMWIRDSFIFSKNVHEKIIVHGHTLIDEVEIKPNRIGIDTGAFATGKLSCLVLEKNTHNILQTRR